MRSIDGPGAVSGRFVDYDAVTNPNGTVYTADFGNDVQDEIVGIQELAGLTEAAGTNRQLIEALKILMPGFNPDVSAWSSGTYSAGEVVKHIGWFWFCGANSTTDEPGVETDWVRCSPFHEKLEGWKTAGWIDIADPKSANFKDYYQVGQYTVDGVDYQRYRLNIAGQSTVLKTSDFGKLIEQSKNVSLFATDNGSNFDLEDYRGCVVSSGDASGGYREANGTRQPHASQKMTGVMSPNGGIGAIRSTDGVATGIFTKGDATGVSVGSTSHDGYQLLVDTAGQTGQTYNTSGDGDGNEGSDPGENYSNNVANGSGYIEVDVVDGIITSVAG